jgi:chemotaxis protein CheD
MNVYLAPGRLFVSDEAVQVSTILGSCVSVCLWDPRSRVGGINHFLLPDGSPPSPRFGSSAMPLLVEGVIEKGAKRELLRARIVGGACVIHAMRKSAAHLGARNVELARERLAHERIPVVGEDVGGDHGRKLLFEVQTGAVLIQPLGPQAAS